jgi:nucleoside-diphosphate-sugar epimerase
MKILFIGGTGNISTECAELLHQQGHEIMVVTRGVSIVPKEYRTIKADRKDLDSMRAGLDGVKADVAINFLGYEISDLEIDFSVLKGAIGQYIFISSATVYSKPPKTLPIREEAPLGNAWWDYAQKKVQCEQWLLEKHKEGRFPLTIVRPSHTYSRMWVPNPIASSSYSFAARMESGLPVFVPDDGENRWTLTAASDFAVALAGLAGKEESIGEAFHITSDEVLTWNQIYSEIGRALGVARPEIVKIPTDFICRIEPSLIGNLKGDKSHPGVFDNTKIKRFVPGFRCSKPFRKGVSESVAWLRGHPEQQNLDPKVDALIERVVHAWKDQGPG